VRAPDDIIDRAVDVIDPETGRRKECGALVQRAAETLRTIEPIIIPDSVSPGKARALLREYAEACRRLERAAFALPFLRPPKEFMILLAQEKERSRQHAAELPNWRGARRRDHLKLAAAIVAREVLDAYGKKATLTVGGPWFVLASTFYEMATGIPDAILSDHCRRCDDPGYAPFAKEVKRRFREGVQDLLLPLLRPGC
jgi:hypothetical protein